MRTESFFDKEDIRRNICGRRNFNRLILGSTTALLGITSFYLSCKTNIEIAKTPASFEFTEADKNSLLDRLYSAENYSQSILEQIERFWLKGSGGSRKNKF